jgi:hypothetical protein
MALHLYQKRVLNQVCVIDGTFLHPMNIYLIDCVQNFGASTRELSLYMAAFFPYQTLPLSNTHTWLFPYIPLVIR